MFQKKPPFQSSMSLMQPLHRTIEYCREQPEWEHVPTIVIKAVARCESMGSLAANCTDGDCLYTGLKEACTAAGANYNVVKSLLVFDYAGQRAFPLFDVQKDRIDDAVEFCKLNGLDTEWFIFFCVKFGLFKLDSRLVIARSAPGAVGFHRVRDMMRRSEAQVLEFVRQYNDVLSPKDRSFTDTVQTWRTGSPLRTEGDYGTQVKKHYNELRLRGHHDS